jgi:hypothetical protein
MFSMALLYVKLNATYGLHIKSRISQFGIRCVDVDISFPVQKSEADIAGVTASSTPLLPAK